MYPHYYLKNDGEQWRVSEEVGRGRGGGVGCTDLYATPPIAGEQTFCILKLEDLCKYGG